MIKKGNRDCIWRKNRVSGLYKKRLIALEKNGIRLRGKNQKNLPGDQVSNANMNINGGAEKKAS